MFVAEDATERFIAEYRKIFKGFYIKSMLEEAKRLKYNLEHFRTLVAQLYSE